jgi:hypothetical protein
MVMSIEEEYRKIGKAVVNECLERWNEECITIALRSVQFIGKLYIRSDDVVEPIAILDFADLIAINLANRNQEARERAEMLANKIRKAPKPIELPRAVIAT